MLSGASSFNNVSSIYNHAMASRPFTEQLTTANLRYIVLNDADDANDDDGLFLSSTEITLSVQSSAQTHLFATASSQLPDHDFGTVSQHTCATGQLFSGNSTRFYRATPC